MKRKSILVVVSDHDTRVNLRLALEARQFNVYSAASGIEAVDLVKLISPPSLIVFDKDLLLQKENFLMTVKSLENFKAIPILALSSDRNEEELITNIANLLSSKENEHH